MTDDSLHQRINTAVNNLDMLLTDVRQGDGTITRLLNEPTLYNNLSSTSVEVRELIANFRRNPRQFLTIQLRIF